MNRTHHVWDYDLIPRSKPEHRLSNHSSWRGSLHVRSHHRRDTFFLLRVFRERQRGSACTGKSNMVTVRGHVLPMWGQNLQHSTRISPAALTVWCSGCKGKAEGTGGHQTEPWEETTHTNSPHLLHPWRSGRYYQCFILLWLVCFNWHVKMYILVKYPVLFLYTYILHDIAVFSNI